MSVAIEFYNTIEENFSIDNNCFNKIIFEDLTIEEIDKLNPVVSTDLSGNVVSRWLDETWDFSYYETKLKKNKSSVDFFNYNYRTSEKLLKEFKLILLLSFYRVFNKTLVSNNIIKISSSIFIFFEEMNNENISSIKELSDKQTFLSLLNKINGRFSISTLKSKLVNLRSAELLNIKNLTFTLNLTHKKRVINDDGFNIDNLAEKYCNPSYKDPKQTLFIPNNIHSKIVSNAIDVINKNIDIIDNISTFIDEEYKSYEKAAQIATNNNKGLSRFELTDKIISIRKSNNEIFTSQELLLKNKLNALFKNFTEVRNECRLIATSCFILISTFSGMRSEEVLNIKKDGYKKVNSEPELHIIRSFETKVSGGQIVDYITSPIIKDVFKALIAIQKPTVDNDPKLKNNDFLFVSSKHQKLFSYSDKSQMRKNFAWFVNKFNITVDNDSYNEHKLLNSGLHENVKLGEEWPLKSHQFRRTLIVNFVSHNLSSIEAVKQQVKHMYSTMTEYYAKNAQLAKQLNFKQSQSIISDIDEEILNSNVIKYKEFYYSDNKLTGLKGEEILKQRNVIDVLSDDDIKLMFKRGAYKLTRSTYGYCTKGDICDKNGIADPTFCGASCDTMIITYENALEWKKLYQRNQKLLGNQEKYLIYGGLKMDGALTMMNNQNIVAQKIMNKFNLEY